MTTNIQDIIKGIESSTVELHSGGLQNISNIHLAIVNGFQLLFGVTNVDPMTGDIEGYKYNLESEINAKGRCKHLAWAFDDMNLITKILEGLSAHYNADLDVKRMLRDIKIPEGRFINLVVTILVVPILVNK